MYINKKELIIWLILLCFIGFVMNIGSHNTIQGYTGKADYKDGGLTLIYLLFWIGAAMWAGMNDKKSVLIAFMIYSIFPLFYFIKFWVATIIYIIWMGPFRGLANMNFFIYLIPTMPAVFLVGYLLSKKYKQSSKINHSS